MEKVSKILVIITWIVSIYLWAVYGFFYLTVGLFILHLAEVFIKGIPVGTKAGKSKLHSVIMTLIFGFTWWLPLQKEIDG